MGMFDDLQKQYIEARKSQDKVTAGILSLLISGLKYEEINKNKDGLDDADVSAFIQKTIKQKKEALSEFEKAGRKDLVEKETSEVAFLSKMLPTMLTEPEVKEIALLAKKELGAVSPADMGKLMKEVMARVKGKADGGMVKNIVTEILKG